MSHTVIHGRLQQGAFKKSDLFHFIHEMSPAQKSFFRETALQHLGKAPSAYWGKQKSPVKISGVPRRTWLYIAEALNHPHHITSHKIMSNHKAAAGLASMAERAGEIGSKVVEYGSKAASFVASHANQILGVANKIHQGIGLAKDFGIIDNDSALAQADSLLGMLPDAT